MHHLSAFFEAAVPINQTNRLLPAVLDPVFRVSAGRIMYPAARRLLGTQLLITDGTGGLYDYPSAFQFSRPVVYPIDTDVAVANLPAVDWRGEKGIVLPGLEDIGALISRAGAAAANVYGFNWTTERFVPASAGSIRTIRCTAAAVTTGAGSWALSALTFDQALPSGSYEVVGMAMEGANTLAGRLVFPGQVERPGTISNITAASWVFPNWRYGAAGRFGSFRNTNPPQLEVLGSGVTTTQVVYLDIVPTSTEFTR